MHFIINDARNNESGNYKKYIDSYESPRCNPFKSRMKGNDRKNSNTAQAIDVSAIT